MRQFASMLVGVVVASGAIAADQGPGQWIDASITVTGEDSGNYDYKLYVPGGERKSPLPLVVMLHGCTQGPDTFAKSTRMNTLAESGRFMVLYPAQKMTANPARCWNWFLPKNQVRDRGEPAAIMAMIEAVGRSHPIDRKRIYVAGLSAGASMAATLAACYPDVFAAAGIHSGTMYKSATDLVEAQKVMMKGEASEPSALGAQAWACGGKRALPVPVSIWHGQGDNIVNRDNGDHLVRQFSRVNDWADDGKDNGSAPQGPTQTTGKVEGGYSYSVATYQAGGRPLMQYYRVAEMGHAWSGGKDDLPFSDGQGPDASRLMWEFFRQFSR